ncbi:MAG: 50S ribosomal protein L23 [Candidatus Micrarchaeia archaeon]
MALLYPITTEKAVSLIERENKIVFIVDARASKADIKEEVERRFGVRVQSVNTLLTPTGKKKAFVRVAKGFRADDIAAKLKIA